MGRFQGRVVAISGAASGLGRDIAQGLATEGAAKLYLFDVDAKGLADTAGSIAAPTVQLCCDVADETSVSRAWQQASDIDGLDVLLTAAGTIGAGTPIEACSVAEWDRIFNINVRGTFLMVKYALPHLRKNKGNIVTFGSSAGLAGSGTLPAYSASKGAVAMFTRSLALAHASDGIRVNSVCPGSIETPMLQATFDAAGSPEAVAARKAEYLKRYPLGRFGAAREVTDAALFLASDQASYTTGVCLPVDGGRLA
ncbi:SDR family NAD(P)-dependent oxidoreductase [Pararobbsia silviterrae]|uniref:SDR family oxidoreductase n=1 Tax=Pararobbsia silviterrae TaxID=1792498 RepID=A0A494Y559_9BURK|nr:SDR family NAD(P)-dependent oxidoreductase [Pararobbsia silviterrae]RKP57818.1 SDR family oxidoreductase [Pararobbsia silviterrae]